MSQGSESPGVDSLLRPRSDPSTPVMISRYGRSHKPKMGDDFVSTDKKVSAYLKLSPGNQLKHYSESVKQNTPKKTSPNKSDEGGGSPRRGRPPKLRSPEFEAAADIKVKVEPQAVGETVEGCEWMAGDLAWARVGGHPFWPCIVALDPAQRIFTKTIRKGRMSVSQRWLHVQFFGDNGRRSWLNTAAIMNYNGRDAFIQLGDTILAGMRKKEPKQTSAFVIKPAVVQVWEKAVQEAEDLLNASREERIDFFTRNFPPPPPQLSKQELIAKVMEGQADSAQKKTGRKRKAERSPEQENKSKQIKLDDVKVKVEQMDGGDPLASTPRTIADRKKRQALLMQMAREGGGQTPPTPPTPPTAAVATEAGPELAAAKPKADLKRTADTQSADTPEKKKPKRRQSKKQIDADFQVFSSKHFDRISDDHPDLMEKDVNKYLKKIWNEMDDTQRARYKARTAPERDASEQSDDEQSSEGSAPEDEGEKEGEGGEGGEDRSSKSGSPAPLATATPKPSAKRSLSNIKSLFSGARAEKVCQACEKVGDTVRCRGPCQAFYHPVCCMDSPPSTVPVDPPITPSGPASKKKGRPKKSMENRVKEESTKKKESETKENGLDDGALQVEIIEGKVRKGSKDSDSGSDEGAEAGFRCHDCIVGRSQPCFVCRKYVHAATADAKLYRCTIAYCGKLYHEPCLRGWPQTQWRGEKTAVVCPQHVCHTCASDNPAVVKARYTNDRLVRCVRCPTTYHNGNFCVPAGSEILTQTQIICPRHYAPKKALLQHVNAAWCFICASGGSLICCDLCPTAFHAKCLNITPPSDGYICEDCQTGRYPLYGEIVWVKLGTYRWWPAQILYPSLIPDNIANLPHVRGEFAVRFFGSHDHYWVNRGRAFLYQDGDSGGKCSYKRSSVDNVFDRAVKEAEEAQRKYLLEKETRDAEPRPGMKPPNYVKLKTNKPVGNVRVMELNVSNLTPCECDPEKDNPCAPESDCLNRILMVECSPMVCPAGEKCGNQFFEKRLYPPMEPFHTRGRGWGLKTLVPIKKGTFVVEYVGEIINEEEYKRRLAQMHANNEENFYFLTIDKDRMLDAGPKGNVSRFMNHSCQPNCETQKWTVNGDTRVGLFACRDIAASEELVFNYNLEVTAGADKKPCMCGAANCSGFIGVKATKPQDKEEAKEKKPVKRKKAKQEASKAHEEDCFVCGEGGELLLCDGKQCLKGYHLSCLGKKQNPQGYWLCPWHQCSVCNKGRVQRCSYCINSYCQEHSEGNIRLCPQRGLICFKHDQANGGCSPMEVDGYKNESNKSADPVDQKTTKAASVKSEEDSGESVDLTVGSDVVEGKAKKRSKRSKSSASDKSFANGAIARTKRRSRPSSVDMNLISCEKTEAKSENDNGTPCTVELPTCAAVVDAKEAETVDQVESKDCEKREEEDCKKGLTKLKDQEDSSAEKTGPTDTIDHVNSELNVSEVGKAELGTSDELHGIDGDNELKANGVQSHRENLEDENIKKKNDKDENKISSDKNDCNGSTEKCEEIVEEKFEKDLSGIKLSSDTQQKEDMSVDKLESCKDVGNVDIRNDEAEKELLVEKVDCNGLVDESEIDNKEKITREFIDEINEFCVKPDTCDQNAEVKSKTDYNYSNRDELSDSVGIQGAEEFIGEKRSSVPLVNGETTSESASKITADKYVTDDQKSNVDNSRLMGIDQERVGKTPDEDGEAQCEKNFDKEIEEMCDGIGEKCSDDNDACKSEESNQVPENVNAKVIEAEIPVDEDKMDSDDFELTYSDCSSDKIYKDSPSPKSSVEVKVSDSISSEDNQMTTSTGDVKNNLTNRIEPANAMEVA